jgi:hypothetical protein
MKKDTITAALSAIFTLSAVLLNTAYLSAVYAQVSGTPGEVGTKNASEPYFAPLNLTGSETATEFDELAGANTGILANDSSISNPNITALDSTSVNEKEACMQIPGNTAENCP